MIEMELAGEQEQRTQETQGSKANTLVCNVNAALALANQELRRMLATQVEQQRILDMQIKRTKEDLENKRGYKSSISRGWKEQDEGVLIESYELYELNPNDDEESGNSEQSYDNQKWFWT